MICTRHTVKIANSYVVLINYCTIIILPGRHNNHNKKIKKDLLMHQNKVLSTEVLEKEMHQ